MSCLDRPGIPWTRGLASGGNTGRHAWNQHTGATKDVPVDLEEIYERIKNGPDPSP